MSKSEMKENIRVTELRDLLKAIERANLEVSESLQAECDTVATDVEGQVATLNELIASNLDLVPPLLIDEMNQEMRDNPYLARREVLARENHFLDASEKKLFGCLGKADESLEEMIVLQSKGEKEAARYDEEVRDAIITDEKQFGEEFPEISAFNKANPKAPITITSVNQTYGPRSFIRRIFGRFLPGNERYFKARHLLESVKDPDSLLTALTKTAALQNALRAAQDRLNNAHVNCQAINETRQKWLEIKERRQFAQTQSSPEKLKPYLCSALCSFMMKPSRFDQVTAAWPAQHKTMASEVVMRIAAFQKLHSYLSNESNSFGSQPSGMASTMSKLDKACRYSSRRTVPAQVGKLKLAASGTRMRGAYLRGNAQKMRGAISGFKLNTPAATQAQARFNSHYNDGRCHAGGGFSFIDYLMWSTLLDSSGADKSFVNQSMAVDKDSFVPVLSPEGAFDVAPDFSTYVGADLLSDMVQAGAIDTSQIDTGDLFNMSAGELTIPDISAVDFSNLSLDTSSFDVSSSIDTGSFSSFDSGSSFDGGGFGGCDCGGGCD